MKLLSYISAALTAIVHVTTSFFTMTIRSAGEATFKVTDMANKAVGKAYEEQLIENVRDLRELYEECGLSEEEIAEVKRQANAYINNDWEADYQRTSKRTANQETRTNQEQTA